MIVPLETKQLHSYGKAGSWLGGGSQPTLQLQDNITYGHSRPDTLVQPIKNSTIPLTIYPRASVSFLLEVVFFFTPILSLLCYK